VIVAVHLIFMILIPEGMMSRPGPSNAKDPRTFARIYTLVSRAAAKASDTLTHGDELVAAFTPSWKRGERGAISIHRRRRPGSIGVDA